MKQFKKAIYNIFGYQMLSIMLMALLLSGCKDQKAIQLAQINAESGMAEGNIEKAIDSYRILLVHDKSDGVAKKNLTLLEGSLKALQNEHFLVFNKNIKQLIVDANKMQKLNKASELALEIDTRLALFNTVNSKLKNGKNESDKIYIAMDWLEKSEELVGSIETCYKEFYSSITSKSIKTASEAESIAYLINMNNQWKSARKNVDLVRVRENLEAYGIAVKYASGEWLSAASVILNVHEKLQPEFRGRSEFDQTSQGWVAGQRLIKHIQSRNNAMAD